MSLWLAVNVKYLYSHYDAENKQQQQPHLSIHSMTHSSNYYCSFKTLTGILITDIWEKPISVDRVLPWKQNHFGMSYDKACGIATLFANGKPAQKALHQS